MTAPTPQNTPLSNAPITREALSRPTVGTISEDNEDGRECRTGRPSRRKWRAALASCAPVAHVAHVKKSSPSAERSLSTRPLSTAAAAVNALKGNPALAGMIQNKLSGLVGRSSGYIESLPPHMKRRVEGLKGIHVDHTKIEAEFQKEILELEKKYAERYRPLYQRRAAIVQGKEEPTKEEVVAGEASHDDAEDEEEDGSEAGEKQSFADVAVPSDGEKGIPEYWLTALKNHVALSELITEKDEDALRALIDVRMTYLPGTQAGFKLEFQFDPARNDFFTNEILTKTYYYQDEVGFSGDLVYDHAEGDKIAWKDDKDLTHKIETKKQRNKNTNQTRTVKRSVPVESFFNFFSPPKPPKDSDNDETDFDEYVFAAMRYGVTERGSDRMYTNSCPPPPNFQQARRTS